MRDAITDVAGIKVGHWSDRRAVTGCTVVLAEAGATAGYISLGGAPGTIDTDLLRPENRVPEVHAVLLSGGSAYGLEAAVGVRTALRERGTGFALGPGLPLMPIVVGAVVFDLGIGRSAAHPDAAAGRRAVRRASGGKVEQGSVGAGTGCTVAKLAGPDFMLKSGIGTASVRHESGLSVGAIVAVNAAGDVYEAENGQLVAGPRGRRRGEMRRGSDLMMQKSLAEYAEEAAEAQGTLAGSMDAFRNTTIGVVATNARLNKAGATRLAIMANDGLAASVRPAHTPADGDTIFALATGDWDVEMGELPGLMALLGSMAASAVSRAIVNGVREAKGLGGVPSVGEWGRRR